MTTYEFTLNPEINTKKPIIVTAENIQQAKKYFLKYALKIEVKQ